MSGVQMAALVAVILFSGGAGYATGELRRVRRWRRYAAAGSLPLHGGGPRPPYRGRREHGRGGR